jgi:hypothetical protein
MAGVARIPRSRGGVTGVLLILLGAWGGLAPFVGPYFRFAYTPDKAWAYTSGRLWLSIVPGAAALLGGLLVLAASHRAVGCVGAVLGLLGGAWFVIGTGVISVAVTNGSISPGVPLDRPVGSLTTATWTFLEQFGFFTGTGILILFCASLALGRFSVVGVRDAALAEEREAALADEVPGGGYSVPDPVTQDVTFPSVPSSTGQFGAAGSQFSPGGEQPPTAAEQFPTTTSPFRRPPSDTGGLGGPS